MRQQTKAIWLFFGLAALLVIIGTITSMSNGDAGGSAVRRGGAMDVVGQIAYPLGLILFAGGLLYLVIRRLRR